MGQRYISKGRIMIDQEIADLFAELNKNVNGLKTDIILIKYAVEQIEEKIDTLIVAQEKDAEKEILDLKDPRWTKL